MKRERSGQGDSPATGGNSAESAASETAEGPLGQLDLTKMDGAAQQDHCRVLEARLADQETLVLHAQAAERAMRAELLELEESRASLLRRCRDLERDLEEARRPPQRARGLSGVALARWLFDRTPVPARWRPRVRDLLRGTFHRLGPAAGTSRGASAIPVAGSVLRPAVGPVPYDVIVFPVIDWNFRHQRPQHIALEFARRGHRVFYLATTFASEGDTDLALEQVHERVFLARLPSVGSPIIYRDILTTEQMDAMVLGLEHLAERFGIPSTLSIVDHPFWQPLMSRLPNNVVLYDRMDHHEGFAETGEAMMELERRLVEQADLVACTSQRIFEGTKQATDKCVLIRNAGEYEHFAERPAQLACESPRRVVGYFGAIAQWFDADLVAHAARERTDLDFVLVGETFGSDLGDLPELPNVTLIGEVGYDELPAYLHSFDVCMIPFKVVELTLSTNPVKVYEYLSAGKPVVSVPLPEVLAMGDVVGIGRDPQGFVRELDAALDEDSEEKREHRRAFARANTWENRGDDLHAAVAHCFPSVSVIVLAWNQLEFTRACLHSLEHFSDYPNWELIVVDNASTDGTVDFLLDYAEGRDHVRLVLNDENLGFAGGNNAGARAATGEYLVFLNNDTYVTSGWLGGMLAHFRAEPELGILNPVTNNIGNEARIEIHYADMTEMAAAADIYTRARRGQRIHLRSAAFFCAMLKRSTWLEVGGLDENFGVGFFEDDDYAMRLREKGFEIGCAEDVFVHHHLSATFDELGADRKREIFEANKAYFESKWGPWVPHRYRQPD